MDDGWVCGSCHSINRPREGRCYKCHLPRGSNGPRADPSASTGTARPTVSVPRSLFGPPSGSGPMVMVLPSLPEAVATLRGYADFDIPGITDLPVATDVAPDFLVQVVPEMRTRPLPLEQRVDALVEASITAWRLIAVASAAGAGADVRALGELLERRTTGVRWFELTRAVDRIVASITADEVARLAGEGRVNLERLGARLPPGADPARTDLANGVESWLGGLYVTPDAQRAGSPMAAYVWCYRTIATRFAAAKPAPSS